MLKWTLIVHRTQNITQKNLTNVGIVIVKNVKMVAFKQMNKMEEDKWWDNKPEKKEKKKKFLIPNLTPKYLQDNKLWDSY